MKRVKRLLCMLLTVCMAFGLLPTTVFSAGDMPFTDVKTTDWFYNSIQYVYENGMMYGLGDTIFSPGTTTTRGMIVTILHRMEGKPSAKGESFVDVNEGEYYANAVAWGSESRIVSGFTDTIFGPNEPITREQMVTIFYRYAAYKNYDVTAKADLRQYGDLGQLSNWAEAGMAWASAEGLIFGTTNTTLSPQNQATRAEAAAIFMRFCKNIVDREELKESEIKELIDKTNTTEYENGDVVYEPENTALAVNEVESVLYYNDLLTVYLKTELTADRIQDLLTVVDGTLVTWMSGSMNVIQIRVAATDLEGLNSLAAMLMGDSDVWYATYDCPIEVAMDGVPLDDKNPWGGESDKNNEDNPGGNDWWAEAIGAYTAWSFEDLSTAIAVGVLDSGFDTDHMELAGKASFLSGYSTNSEHFHGTGAASVIASYDNNVGLRGVANKARVICADLSPNNADGLIMTSTGEYLQITKRMIERGVKVINNSWGIRLSTRTQFEKNLNAEKDLDEQFWLHVAKLLLKEDYENYQEHMDQLYETYLNLMETQAEHTGMQCFMMMSELMINDQGDFLIVKTAGNGYEGGHGHDAELSGYYCAIDQELLEEQLDQETRNELALEGVTYNSINNRILVVGATEKPSGGRYNLTDFSNFGSQVDIVAPGRSIYCADVNDGYQSLDGTSFSAPMVAGAAALLKSMDGSLTMPQVRAILLAASNTAYGVTGGDRGVGYSLLNVGSAVESIASHVKIYVTDLEGNFLDNAEIKILDKSNKEREIKLVTDEDGTQYYYGSTLDGDVEIEVAVEGYITQTKSDSISKDKEYTFEMEPCGEIRGTVKDKENGNSLSGASVTLLLEGKEVKSTFTEENGSFLLDKIQPGSYTLLIQKLYYKELTYTVTLSGSETLVILDDILLEPEENGIHGTVVDAKTGEVISGATVSVSNTALAKKYASITGADGTFVIEIEGYNAVTWTVEITAEGYQKTSKSVSTWIGIVDMGVIQLKPEKEEDGIWDGSIADCYEGGTGTKDDPYQIAGGSQLALLAYEVNNGDTHEGDYFVLIQDIYLNDVSEREDRAFIGSYAFTDQVVWQDETNEWTPIGHKGLYEGNRGWGENGEAAFSGVFDGKKFTVYGTMITNYEYDGCGLFGYVDKGTVKNVTVADTLIRGNNGTGGVVGLIVDGTISNCIHTGYTMGAYFVGGIAGSAQGTSSVTNCKNLGNNGYLTGGDLGGIVGLVYDASVSGCTNSMYIWGNTLPFGGIVGMAYGGSISGCSSKGVIFVSQDYAAGQTLVGRVVGGQSDSSIYSNSGACIVYNYSKNAEVSGIPNVGYNVAYPLS